MAKPRPYRAFGKLLTEGIKQLDRHRSLGPVQEDLAQELGCASSTIYTWRRGEHLPEPEIIEKLAQIFEQRWQADETWIDRFLEKGEYGPPRRRPSSKKSYLGKRQSPKRPRLALLRQSNGRHPCGTQPIPYPNPLFNPGSTRPEGQLPV